MAFSPHALPAVRPFRLIHDKLREAGCVEPKTERPIPQRLKPNVGPKSVPRHGRRSGSPADDTHPVAPAAAGPDTRAGSLPDGGGARGRVL